MSSFSLARMAACKRVLGILLSIACITSCTRITLFGPPHEGFQGLAVPLERARPESPSPLPLHVLFVHGIACQHLEWANDLQSNIIHQLAGSKIDRRALPQPIRTLYKLKLGEAGDQGKEESGSAILGKPLNVVGIEAVAEIPELKCAGELAKMLEGGSKPTSTDGYEATPSAYIAIASYPSLGTSFVTVTWSQIPEYVKAQRLDYESELCDHHSAHFSRLDSCRRALVNGLLKSRIVDTKLADAIVYLGARKPVIQAVVANGLCLLRAEHPESKEAAESCQRSVADASALHGRKAAARIEPSSGDCPKMQFAFVTHSLGSRVLFDALTSDGAAPLLHCLTTGSRGFYMLANQLPLLELTEPDARQTVNRITERGVLGHSFDTWDATGDDSPQSIAKGIDALDADAGVVQKDLATLFSDGVKKDRITVAGFERDTIKGRQSEADQILQNTLQTAQGAKATWEALEHAKTTQQGRLRDAAQRDGEAQKEMDARQKEYQEKLDEAQQYARAGITKSEALRASMCLTKVSPLILLPRASLGADLVSDYHKKLAAADEGIVWGSYPSEKVQDFEPLVLALAPAIRDAHRILDSMNTLQNLVNNTQNSMCAAVGSSIVPTVEFLHGGAARQKNLQDSLTGFTSGLQQLHETNTAMQNRVHSAHNALGNLDSYCFSGNKRCVQTKFAHSSVGTADEVAKSIAEVVDEGERNRTALQSLASQMHDIDSQILIQRPGFWDQLSALETKYNSARLAHSDTEKKHTAARKAYADSQIEAASAKEASDSADRKAAKAQTEASFTQALLETKDRELDELRNKAFDPKSEGMLALSVLFDSQPEHIRRKQAELLERRPGDPRHQHAYQLLSAALKQKAGSPEHISVIAFSDPNDLLTFPVPPTFSSDYPEMQFENVVIRASWELLWLYGDPVGSHTAHLHSEKIAALIVHGCNSETSGRLPMWLGSACRAKTLPVVRSGTEKQVQVVDGSR